MDNGTAPTLDQLRALIKVAEGKGYEAAGGGSKQAGYQKLKRLEEALLGADVHMRLVATGGRQLTPEGTLLVAEVRALVEGLERLMSHAKEVSGKQFVRVACLPAHVQVVERAWDEWAGQDPTRTVELRDVSDRHRDDLGAELRTMLRAGSIDMAIISRPVGPDALSSSIATEGLEYHHVYGWPIRCVMPESHPLATRPEVDVGELADGHDAILASPPAHVSRQVLDETGMDLQFAFVSSSVDALVELATYGKGIALVAGDAIPVQQLLKDRRVPLLTHGDRRLEGDTTLITTAERRPHIEQFVEVLLRVAPESLKLR